MLTGRVGWVVAGAVVGGDCLPGSASEVGEVIGVG